jgi:hypothetical protein
MDNNQFTHSEFLNLIRKFDRINKRHGTSFYGQTFSEFMGEDIIKAENYNGGGFKAIWTFQNPEVVAKLRMLSSPYFETLLKIQKIQQENKHGTIQTTT